MRSGRIRRARHAGASLRRDHSQKPGSEHPAGIVPVLTQHCAMVQRNLLYTGTSAASLMAVPLLQVLVMRHVAQIALRALLEIAPQQLRKAAVANPSISPRRVGRGPAHDVGLDHKVASTANYHKMFDIVAADEDDASFPVDRQGFDYCYPRWCVAAAEPVEHVLSPPQRMPVREGIRRCLANVPMSAVFPRGYRGGSTPTTSS
jgi:hypothetical protein